MVGFMQGQPDIILTGLPRSGTTLTCHLLNKLPDCVALHEPINPLLFQGWDEPDIVRYIQAYFTGQRQQILRDGKADSKSTGGRVPDNPMAGVDPATGRRIKVLDGYHIQIDKLVNHSFTLVIKQPAFFTALLGGLVSSFPCFAIVRNPLSVLLSWNTVALPVAEGRVPAAEAFSPGLGSSLDAINDVHDRQIALLSWFFAQYRQHLQPSQVLFYEGIISQGGASLAVICDSARSLREALSSKNNNTLYNPSQKNYLAEKLLQHKDAAFWDFYSQDDVVQLAAIN